MTATEDKYTILYSGTLGTTSAQLFDAVTSLNTFITEILICNKSQQDVPVSLTIGTTYILASKVIPHNETIVIDTHTILSPGSILYGIAGLANSIDVHISGIKVVNANS